ncbi:MAG: hypothetical protein IKE20_00730 [Eggerthellaceae bacterium]|nr:hypothetical protein [Eggerthellaceae bacterium]
MSKFYLVNDSSRMFDHLDEAIEVAAATDDVVMENNVVVWRRREELFDGMLAVKQVRMPCVDYDGIVVDIRSRRTKRGRTKIAKESEYYKLLYADVDPKEPLL